MKIKLFVLFIIFSNIIFAQNKTCEDAVFAIVSSSKSYKWATNGLEKAVIKNGGKGIGWIMYSSPNPERYNALSKSDFYEIVLHETYSDRNFNFRTYVFKPKNLTLYKRDNLNNVLIPIKYNKKLLPLYKSKCLK
ncbi:hypothetical protein [Halpernia frigidisoli]|uniref:Uncharacterized protein n=1 Tax=Halpernia frigidisoli TaxID=1125876 RepID=A0A1I3E1I1_9FLAO|nr:hypothetical protein [Halpernia frigidisoli]SFH92719.1 hypothetical protein SAMN05443292_0820 [Halpernia frigidisoli]